MQLSIILPPMGGGRPRPQSGRGQVGGIRTVTSPLSMTSYVALLRAVNIAGGSVVAMSDLRRLLTDLGFNDARSLLQSGNLAFKANATEAAKLESRLEAETEKRLGLKTAYFVRTHEDMEAVVAGNPYPTEAQRDPGHLVVVFLKEAPKAGAVEVLRAAIKGPEVVQAKGRHAYIYYPNGIGHSRLTGAVIDSRLGTQGTGRNWNTVLKLAALVKA
jgi:uncharacterized protein (DUF1697 family)